MNWRSSRRLLLLSAGVLLLALALLVVILRFQQAESVARVTDKARQVALELRMSSCSEDSVAMSPAAGASLCKIGREYRRNPVTLSRLAHQSA